MLNQHPPEARDGATKIPNGVDPNDATSVRTPPASQSEQWGVSFEPMGTFTTRHSLPFEMYKTVRSPGGDYMDIVTQEWRLDSRDRETL